MTRTTSFDARRVASCAAAALALTGIAGGLWGAGAALANPQAPRAPYERPTRMLPLQLSAPAVAQVGRPIGGISVRLHNPGAEAPEARLRIIIHEKSHGHGHHDLDPDTVKVEVFEGGTWKPVLLEVVDGGVMGAIGGEEVAQHRERHRRGGFAIHRGFDRRWPLRVTFDVTGTYTLLVAVSPDNGSRHLAQPAFSHIEVR